MSNLLQHKGILVSVTFVALLTLIYLVATQQNNLAMCLVLVAWIASMFSRNMTVVLASGLAVTGTLWLVQRMQQTTQPWSGDRGKHSGKHSGKHRGKRISKRSWFQTEGFEDAESEVPENPDQINPDDNEVVVSDDPANKANVLEPPAPATSTEIQLKEIQSKLDALQTEVSSLKKKGS